MTTERVLITSALPYANGPLHFGHLAGAYLPADCYARFQRLIGNDVLFLSGSDEYGIAITLSAELAGRDPQSHVDIFHAMNQALFKRLNFSYDHFSRTTWKGHKQPVHQYFLDLLHNGYIEERVTDQLYSEADGKFLADRYVVGECPKCGFQNARGDECPNCGASYEATDLKNPRSKLTQAPLQRKPTKHWFLLLDKFKERLSQWLETKSDWKSNVLNFAKGYVNELHARAITRDSSWGIPVPLQGSEGKVLYVWFDAPIGYISAAMEWAQLKGEPDLWKKYWQDSSTRLVHFVGKDNIPFHAVIFPAMTLGQNQPYKLVDDLPANEFFKLEGKQFSKSDNWFIDVEEFLSKYSVDQIRYAIAANAPETADAEFTWSDFQLRCNSDLLGKYGNLVNRVLVFAKNRCEGKVPPQGRLEAVDRDFLAEVHRLTNQAAEYYKSYRLRAASQTVMELAQLGNVYFDHKKPWQDAKQPETADRMKTTIACCLECLKALALVSSPIIPETANRVWQMLGYTTVLDEQSWSQVSQKAIPEGQSLKEPVILFQRIEDAQIEEERAKLYSKTQQQAEVSVESAKYEPLRPEIDIDHVRKMDLRIGVILSAVPVPKSKKLLQLDVDLGFEKRTVVAGISLAYKPEELIGKRVVVVANLKPATLMGVQSHGMLLAGSSCIDDALELATVHNLPPGSSVS